MLLEKRALRWGTIGASLVLAATVSVMPTPVGVDAGWLFLLPVVVAAIAAGLTEGLAVATLVSLLSAAVIGVQLGRFDTSIFAGALASKFAFYGIAAGVLGVFADAHRTVQADLRALAATDPLTRVANVARFQFELGLLEADRAPFALLVVDLDGLKAINDAHGHQTGSAAIQAVARSLRAVVRSTDCVARFGGDEFVVILKGADRAGTQIVVNRVNELLENEVLPSAPDVKVRVSTGVSLFGEDGTTAEELLAAADAAMYVEKRARKN